MIGLGRVALNHMVAPRRGLEAFFDLAVALGLGAVEIRNDLPGTAIADGTRAATVAALAEARGLKVLSINALQRCNDWTSAREAEARTLIGYARDCGAAALVLCPVNDAVFAPADDGLRTALAALAPLLREAGVAGLLEPLGFSASSLRSKRDAVAAIDAAGASDAISLVHDTFHHAVAGEPELFPARTGLVHVSGVADPDVPRGSMRDAHRGLVSSRDRIDNIGQIRALLAGGYDGPFSFEPFAADVHGLPDVRAALADSIGFIRRELDAQAG